MEVFIRKNGVTKCPGAFTPELAELNQQRTADYLNMTPEQRKEYHKKKHSGRRRSALTPEQRKEKIRAYHRARYAKKKAAKA